MNDLKLSVLFGIASRFLTFLNQIFSVPITITLIGLNEFTRFNVMTATIAWLITLGGCLLPSVVGDIARAKSDHDYDSVTRKTSSALAVMFIFCLIISVAYILVFNDLGIEYNVLLVLTLLILFSSTAENIRQGLGENYKNAIYNGLSNFLSLLAILSLYFFKIETDLLIILVVSLGSTVLLKMANLAPLLVFFELNKVNKNDCYEMIRKAIGFLFISVAYYLNNAGLVTLFGYFSYPQLSEYVILQKIILILMGLVVMIRNPLWSIIASLNYKGNGNVIYHKYIKILRLYFLAVPIIIIFLCFGLPSFLKIWAGGIMIAKKDIILFSLYVAVLIFSYINSVMYYGLELFGAVSKLIMLEAIVNFSFAVVAVILNLHMIYIFLMLIITSLIINGLVFRLIKRTCLNV